ncbi:DUF6600 domain-containing protein [Pedobacter flavus]|uniref:DUF6600 domain-containing protein n=1 Tax=Pedobacter flavus TaxID=3113906 RepID=A0ABU7GZQ9_9SPHI|nr:DUF6600 domain-containing protein [Pedobacter sp. VNH31]MEE1884542.1 DUF6600 domain-containing protein [Pedobacter sp. VNH31]
MEFKIKLSALMLGLMFLFSGQSVKAQDDYVSLQQFYDELSPYGTWINDPQYGYVWRPDVDQSSFRPYYTNGRWVQTVYGNTWVSNYDWGWAPFHYGRWVLDRYNRWLWIPDTVWGPAWVDWRSGNGYYGWAPMGPSINIHINIGRRYVRPDYAWNFIPMHNIYIGNYPRYRAYNNVRIINRTKIINNTYVYNSRTYYTGPRPEEVRRATRQDVKVYDIARNNRIDAPRIDRNTVNVYSPRPSRENSGNAAPRGLDNSNNGRNINEGRNGATTAPRVESRGEKRPTSVPNRNMGSSSAERPERGGIVPNTRDMPPVNNTSPQRSQQNREGNVSTAPPQSPREMSAPGRSQNVPAQQQAPRQQSAPRPQADNRQQQQRNERPQVQQRTPQQSQPRQQQSRGNSGNNNSGGGRAESGRPGRG